MRRSVVLAIALLTSSCGGSATSPSNVGGPAGLVLQCSSSTTQMTCTATVSCGMKTCQPGTPSDVTQVASWTSDSEGIVHSVGLGKFVGVSVGDAVVHAKWDVFTGVQTVSVFPGTAPLATGPFWGWVYEAGKTFLTGPIDGATVQIVDGPLQGRTAISGAPPSPIPPGYSYTTTPQHGSYEFFGVPLGTATFRLRVTKDGYVSVERDVNNASIPADFALQRQ